MTLVAYETPRQLLTRLKLGREEAMQRMLTTLVLDGPYPHWNERSVPSPAGVAFLRALHSLSFGGGWGGDDLLFVDELELPGRSDDERGGAPDYAVLWPDRVWIIELKTEVSSHRPAQLPSYLALAHHHHPGCAIDLTYLTPSMLKPPPEPHPWSRFAHLTWGEVAPIIRSTWASPETDEQADVVHRLCEACDLLHLTSGEWRRHVTGGPGVTVPALDPLEVGLMAVRCTAADGLQRALDVPFTSLDALLELRLELKRAIEEQPERAPVRQVRPWVWRRATSGGHPLSQVGEQEGYELRVSRGASTG